MIRMSTADMLAELGHTVSEAADGAEAMKLLDKDSFDVIVTDLSLPDIPGEEVAARAAKRQPGLAVVFATFASLAGLLTAAPASAAPSPMPARVVVAPSGAVDSLNGLSIADDGSGGMVFLETVAGVPHVFVSRLEHGAWQPPEQADVGLSAASSQPQIAAHNHGELVVAFVNSGALYVNTVRYRKQLFSTPQELATGASNPTVSINGAKGQELSTPLGTVLTFTRGGVSYTVLGSVPATAAE